MKVIINGELKEAEKLTDLWDPEGGCYEVIRFISGKPLFWEEHLKRLEKSYQEAIDKKALRNGADTLVTALGDVSENMYISYLGSDRGYAMYFFPGFYPPEAWYEEGIKVTLIPVERDNPEKKITSGSYKEQVKRYLKEKDVFEGLLTDHGKIREGSRSNVFFIKAGGLITSKGDKVLPGITREKVYDICRELGITIEERSLEIQELEGVEGLFITGTSIDILPVTGIDDLFFGTIGSKVYQEIHDRYEVLKEKDLA